MHSLFIKCGREWRRIIRTCPYVAVGDVLNMRHDAINNDVEFISDKSPVKQNINTISEQIMNQNHIYLLKNLIKSNCLRKNR